MGAPQYEQAGADVAGSGTTNTIPRWTGPSTLGDSVITQSGSFIGIGTASPSTRLHVSDNSSIPVIVQSSGSTDSYLRFINTSNNLGYIGYVGTNLYLAPNNGAGNVGIGTASPNFRLTVQGAAGSIAQFSNGVNADLLINLTAGVSLITPATGTLALGTSSVERMRIDSTGNVGIGTASPAVKFHVNDGTNKNLRAYGAASGFQLLSATDAGGEAPFTLQGSTVTFTTAGVGRLSITNTGNVQAASGTTTMTDGFFYIPAAAGAPTGVPTAIAGRVPMYYDTTNNEFYVYNTAWKKVALL